MSERETLLITEVPPIIKDTLFYCFRTLVHSLSTQIELWAHAHMAVKYSGCAGKIHLLFEAFTEIGIETHPEAGVHI